MSTYKLYYFNLKARAELARTIFAQAGQSYEDIRFTKEEWVSKYKALSPFGCAPWLEVDGAAIGGSSEIGRFLGERLGLAGANALENAQLAAISDNFRDFLKEATKGIFESDAEKKKELFKEFQEKHSSQFLDRFEKRITAEGWIYGPKLTWVDILFFNAFEFISAAYPDLLKNYPKLTALVKNVSDQPNIAKWIKDRPQTPM